MRPATRRVTAEQGEGRPGETYRDVVRRLRDAQKPAARGAPAYSRFVNRRIGRYLAAGAYRAGLSPNAVTLLSALFTFSGIALVAVVPPTLWQGVTVAALLVIGYALDSADGQVARLTGKGSTAGEWLDHVVDAVKVVTLPLAILIALYRSDVEPVWLGVPLVAAIVSSVLFFTMILTEQLRRQAGSVPVAGDGDRPSWLRSVLVVPTDYGILCLSLGLLGAVEAFLVVYATIVALTTLFLVVGVAKWFREMNGLRSDQNRTDDIAQGLEQ